jgi:hypothetical protein
MQAGELSQRSLLRRAGLLGLATALGELPDHLAARGLADRARRQAGAVTDDTLAGLVAFVLPGDDAFSVQQGESHQAPGGIAAGIVSLLREGLDSVAREGAPVAGATGIALLLNDYALRVDPAAARGPFRAPFARLTHAYKSDVFQVFEADPELSGSELRFLARILPGFVAFVAFAETGVYAPGQRAVARRAVGWSDEAAPRGRRFRRGR